MSTLTSYFICAWWLFGLAGFVVGCVDSHDHGYLTWRRALLAATLGFLLGPLFFLAALIVADSGGKKGGAA